MRKYSRWLDDIRINIILENDFYEKNIGFFCALLNSYALCPNEELTVDEIFNFYIYEREYSSWEISSNWAFVLIKKLEAFYINVLQSTVVHGSCVQLHGKNILLLGKRLSGKTTITQYLTFQKKADYLDDDCIYFFRKRYIGFGMPMPVRGGSGASYNKHYIAQTTDTDGIIRHLYSAPSYLNSTPKIDIVVFPKFNVTSKPRCLRLTQRECFEKTLGNIRKYYDMKALYVDINMLSVNIDSYCIDYSSSEMAYELLKEII